MASELIGETLFLPYHPFHGFHDISASKASACQTPYEYFLRGEDGGEVFGVEKIVTKYHIGHHCVRYLGFHVSMSMCGVKLGVRGLRGLSNDKRLHTWMINDHDLLLW